MYEKHYGLKQKPFNITPDPAFIYLSSNFHEGIECLRYSVKRGEGVIIITGDVGTGKTTLSRFIAEDIKEYSNNKCILISNPFFTEENLRDIINKNFASNDKVFDKNEQKEENLPQVSIKSPFENSNRKKLQAIMVADLNGKNLEECKNNEENENSTNMLIIDEAHKLTVSQLEKISILSNIETNKEKLLQIVLIGQPELLSHLEFESLNQLKQRVSVHYKLHPLKKHELSKYLYHRLSVSGSTGKVTFTDKAIGRIFKFSKGFQRKVNILTDKALLIGYIENKNIIDKDIVNKAIKSVCLSMDNFIKKLFTGIAAFAFVLLLFVVSVPIFKNYINKNIMHGKIEPLVNLPPSAADPVKSFKNGKDVFYVLPPRTYIYKYASKDSEVILQTKMALNVNEVFNDNDWIKIKTMDNVYGWVKN